jgi:hypothetical protein
VSEPFASGFEPDRTFAVTTPDGYAIVSAEPEPTTHDGDATDDTAGFGVAAGVLALRTAVFLSVRKRER